MLLITPIMLWPLIMNMNMIMLRINTVAVLVPSVRVVAAEVCVEPSRNDYQAMGPMFIGDPPEFDTLIASIRSIETELRARL